MKTRALAILVLTMICEPAPARPPAGVESWQQEARMRWWREARFGLFVDSGTQVDPASFDADAWARLARLAGMRYVVITTEDHDGVVTRKLVEACRRYGLRVGWDHDLQGSDAASQRAEVTERLTNYGPIDIMWFHGEGQDTWTDDGLALYGLVRELSPATIINDLVDKTQQIPATGLPGVDWEVSVTIDDSPVHTLVDVVSKGGNLLLDVGPTPRGEIPPENVARLEAVGGWMDTNGTSIYGTTASPFHRLPWGRCTQKRAGGGTVLYLHVFDWPADGLLTVPGLRNEIRSAHLLADPGGSALSTVPAYAGGPAIVVGTRAPDTDVPVIAARIVGVPDIEPYVIREGPDGRIVLDAIDATVDGRVARYESAVGKDNIGFWAEQRDAVTWAFELARPGRFAVAIEYACEPDSGGRFRVSVDGNGIDAEVAETASWIDYRLMGLGSVTLTEAGTQTLRVEPIEIDGALMNLRRVQLKRMTW